MNRILKNTKKTKTKGIIVNFFINYIEGTHSRSDKNMGRNDEYKPTTYKRYKWNLNNVIKNLLIVVPVVVSIVIPIWVLIVDYSYFWLALTLSPSVMLFVYVIAMWLEPIYYKMKFGLVIFVCIIWIIVASLASFVLANEINFKELSGGLILAMIVALISGIYKLSSTK